MRVLVTGSNRFIGKKLVVRLGELYGFEVLRFNRDNPFEDFDALVAQSDTAIHLAGINQPKDVKEFVEENDALTKRLCELIAAYGRLVPLVVSSSSQAYSASAYDNSKRAAEEAVEWLVNTTGNSVTIYRLPKVQGAMK